MGKSIIIRVDVFGTLTATLYDEYGEFEKSTGTMTLTNDPTGFEHGAIIAFEELLTEETIVGGNALKVGFKRYGKRVSAKVLEMDESYRGKETLLKNGEYEVRSIDHPAMTEFTLYVRGCSKRKDKDIFTREFPNEKEAIDYITNISELICQINDEKKCALWNAKVVCTGAHEPYFTKGKIYEISKGTITDNTGEELGGYESLNAMNNSTVAQFIEIVE